MLGRTMTELTGTLSCLPAPRAQRVGIGDPEPMELVCRFVAQPLQDLALFANRPLRAFKRWNQKHALLEPGHHRDLSGFAKPPFGLRLNVAHIGHDNPGMPLPAALAVHHARLKEAALAVIGWRRPTDQRHQQDSSRIALHPEPKRVLLVADKETALSAFER